MLNFPSLLNACLSTATLLLLSTSSFSSLAQSAPGTAVQSALELPANADSKKVDEVLQTLRPPTNFKSLLAGNDLWMEFPDVAASGKVRIKLLSAMPQTDAFWLFTLAAQPETGAAQLASASFGIAVLPETTLTVNLVQTQTLLFVARANGKYYAVQREIKIGQSKGARSAP